MGRVSRERMSVNRAVRMGTSSKMHRSHPRKLLQAPLPNRHAQRQIMGKAVQRSVGPALPFCQALTRSQTMGAAVCRWGWATAGSWDLRVLAVSSKLVLGLVQDHPSAKHGHDRSLDCMGGNYAYWEHKVHKPMGTVQHRTALSTTHDAQAQTPARWRRHPGSSPLQTNPLLA
eukprot:scaffold195773_cov15-Tisochrysis_lutea.AAC.1